VFFSGAEQAGREIKHLLISGAQVKYDWSYTPVPNYAFAVWPGKTLSFKCVKSLLGGPGSSVGIVTDYGLDGPGSNRVFPGGKVRPGCAADHSLPSSATVMEE